MNSTIVSCPGKVLIAGGYLVLDPAYHGMVVGTSSRFYTVVRSALSEKAEYSSIMITARSPQFRDAEWSYRAELSETNGQGIILTQVGSQDRKNKFIEHSICESLRLSIALQSEKSKLKSFADECLSKDGAIRTHCLSIDVLADNDFYSQPRGQIDDPVPFNRLNTTLDKVHKTGLGSSSAMVTSLCSAILIHLTPSLDGRLDSTRQIVHNLAQYVHSLAQGKVGSGFDVSAAVWGSHEYRRFSEKCLNGLLSIDGSQITPKILRDAIDPRINLVWNDPMAGPKIERFSIPKFTTLIMADVDGGSHTPSMVGKVLKWRAEEQETANEIWLKISCLNNMLRKTFTRLEELYAHNNSLYMGELFKLAGQPITLPTVTSDSVTRESDVRNLFLNSSITMKETRKLMKNMGERSNVPIEPDSQTSLLDECEKIPGVLGSGVPGAGGYDAIWVLVLSPPEGPKTGIEKLLKLWNEWSEASVKSLSPDAWVFGGSDSSETCQTGIQVIDSIHDVRGMGEILKI
ncbi:ribosomal protein S5 domain 2-type protein [Phakopsora pachyrhizi]|nr:ribosomal protein S5 domain 2-type protein [Phakopsora pachyrhizi]